MPDEEIEALSQRLALCGVRFTPRARGDLEAIIDYLSHQNLQGARNVRRSLEATINLIGHFPESISTWFIGWSKAVKPGLSIFATVASKLGTAASRSPDRRATSSQGSIFNDAPGDCRGARLQHQHMTMAVKLPERGVAV